jgi:mannose-1-phosphate guanylyltransferase/mannose-1-phosphate guanylyltransferase/mannose-6-phosphate isomerase
MKIIRSAALTFIPASHEDPNAPGAFKKILLRGDDLLDGKIETVNTALLPLGKSFTPHYHTHRQEIFIMTRGHAKIAVDKEETTLGKGDTVVVPVGSVHSMENTGKEDVEFIVIALSTGAGGKTVVV